MIAWAQRMAERPDGAHVAAFELAATLIGSGGTGITAGQAAQLIAQGVREANERLSAGELAAASAHLYLIELYLDRAIEAWRALQDPAAATPGALRRDRHGAARRPGRCSRPLDAGYRGADYDFIRATTQRRPDRRAASTTRSTPSGRAPRCARRRRRLALVRELVASASNDRSQDTRIGRTLFQLLVPVEMEPFLGGTTEMVIELDSGTAGIPWELLDTNTRRRAATRGRGRFAPSCCASCGRPDSARRSSMPARMRACS